MDRERIIALFFFGLLALITYQLYGVIEPFLPSIAWAILLAFMAHPALAGLNRYIKSRSTCALVIAIGVALGVILPAVWLSAQLVREAQGLYTTLSHVSAGDSVDRAVAWIRGTSLGARLDTMLTSHGIRLEDQVHKIAVSAAQLTSDYTVKHGSAVASNIVGFIFHFAIALTTFYYLLRDGESYYAGLQQLTPLHEADKIAVFDTLRLTLSSVMRGLMLTSLLDGITLGLGYLVLGVPYWGLLALLSAAAGLLPIGGTAVVFIPAAIYLGLTSSWMSAIILLVWAMIVLAIIDNVIKPLAMGHGTGMPTVVLFFALAGGLEAYGPLGIFIGPAVVAVFSALLRVYRREYVREEVASPTPPTEGT